MSIKIYLHDHIKSFLLNRNWTEVEYDEKRYIEMVPPSDLGFDDYSLRLFQDYSKTDYSAYNKKLIEIISQIYDIKFDDLYNSLLKQGEVLSIRITDDFVSDGSIDFNSFGDFYKGLKDLLFDVASFTLEDKPVIIDSPAEAELYLSECKFLQTQQGSFITRVLLPSNIPLRPNSLFQDGISSSQVNKKLVEILKFSKANIFNSEVSADVYDQEFFRKNKGNINLNVVKSLKYIYSSSSIKNTEFNILSTKGEESIIDIKNVTNRNLDNLDLLIKKIESISNESTVPIKLNSAFVTSLKIKGLDYEKNTIQILGVHQRLGPITVNIKLEEQDYLKAVDAHLNRLKVNFEGEIRKHKGSGNRYSAEKIEILSFS